MNFWGYWLYNFFYMQSLGKKFTIFLLKLEPNIRSRDSISTFILIFQIF